MVNDVRLFAGKKPIGFINPSVRSFPYCSFGFPLVFLLDLVFENQIYSEAFKGAFNDVTSGNNPGCGSQGFAAAPGWDPVTGLGTPSFMKLLIRWLVLP